MIKVTRLDGNELVLNADLIEFVEANPDTVVSLTTGKKIMIRETIDEVVSRVAEFKRRFSATASPEKAAAARSEYYGG